MSCKMLSLSIFVAFFVMQFPSFADTQAKDSSEFTKAFQQSILESLPFDDVRDFELAEKGLISRPDEVTIKDIW